MSPRRFTIKSHWLIALLTGYFTLIFNWPFFAKVYFYIFTLDEIHTLFSLSIPLLVYAFLFPVVSLLVVKGMTRLLVIPVMIVSAMVSYASLNYGAMLDSGMIENVLETNTAESFSYLNSSAVLYILITGVLPALLLLTFTVRFQTFWRELLVRIGLVCCAVLVFAGIALAFYQDYASVGRNNQQVQKYLIPSEWLYSSVSYAIDKYLVKPQPFKVLGEDARHLAVSDKPTLMVVVVGETARAMNLEYNGYERPTNPFTRPLGMVSLGAVESCGTATAVSVPCMFSLLNRKNYDRQSALNQDNVLDIIHRSGYQVTWIDNDGGCKGVCERVAKIKTDPGGNPDYCNGDTCYDEVVLNYLGQVLDEEVADRVVVLHLIGSHGPTYFQRYPKGQDYFKPDCDRSDIQNCSREALINTYDNTIRYTDFVLARLVGMLEEEASAYQVAMLYISDHGESLGENGIYLHGLPYRLAPGEQNNVPELMWLSSQYSQSHQITGDCLKNAAGEKRLSHDNFSHTLLGMLDISTSVYQPPMDASIACHNLAERMWFQDEARHG